MIQLGPFKYEPTDGSLVASVVTMLGLALVGLFAYGIMVTGGACLPGHEHCGEHMHCRSRASLGSDEYNTLRALAGVPEVEQ